MPRNVLADRLKGYACFLVLFGHVIMGMRNADIQMPSFFGGLESFIWSFHVSLFLYLSGAVYKITGEWQSKKTRGGFIKHKLLNLGVPYVVFSAVYIAINSFVGGANTRSSLWDILDIWKTPVAQYWFLYALFFLFCLWTALSGCLKNWQITLFTVSAAYLAPLFGVQFGSFEVVVFSALAFGLGTCTDIEQIAEIPTKFKPIAIFIHLAVAIILIKIGINEYPIAKEALTVLGILASILFISMLQQIKPVAAFLDFMNKYSFQIYLLHTIFTAGVRIILLSFGITQWWLHILAGCVCGTAFSVLAAVICKRVKILNACFFPTKAFGKKTVTNCK